MLASTEPTQVRARSGPSAETGSRQSPASLTQKLPPILFNGVRIRLQTTLKGRLQRATAKAKQTRNFGVFFFPPNLTGLFAHILWFWFLWDFCVYRCLCLSDCVCALCFFFGSLFFVLFWLFIFIIIIYLFVF